MKRVISRLCGGLGNQMFQYATAAALAHRNRARLTVDTTLLHGRQTRTYALDVFNIKAEVAPHRGIRAGVFRIACSSRAALKPFGWATRLAMGMVVRKESTPFSFDKSLDSDLLALADGHTLCLQGYWQCPGYFADAEELVRQEFTFKTRPSFPNVSMLEIIHAVNSVSLHIRRGDYLKVRTQPVLLLDYYYRAAELVATRVQNPHFFVFSDDVAWAKANLRGPYELAFVDTNGPPAAHEDLRLMSACKHHIIANSSFSWWGAWLSPNRQKLVVVPKYWDGTVHSHFPELIPPNWIRMENLQ